MVIDMIEETASGGMSKWNCGYYSIFWSLQEKRI